MIVSNRYVKIRARQVIQSYIDSKNFITIKTMNPTRIKIINTIKDMIDEKTNFSDREVYDAISSMADWLRNSDSFGVTGKKGSSFLLRVDKFLSEVKPIIEYQESKDFKEFKAFSETVDREYSRYVALTENKRMEDSDELKRVVSFLRGELYIRYMKNVNPDEQIRCEVGRARNQLKLDEYDLDCKPSLNDAKFALQWSEAGGSRNDFPIWSKFQNILESCFNCLGKEDSHQVVNLMEVPLRKSVVQFIKLLGVGLREVSYSNESESWMEQSKKELDSDQIENQVQFRKEKLFWSSKDRLLKLYVDSLKAVIIKNRGTGEGVGFDPEKYKELAHKIWCQSLSHIVCILYNFSGGTEDIKPAKNIMPMDCDFEKFKHYLYEMLIQEGLLEDPCPKLVSSSSHDSVSSMAAFGLFAQESPRGVVVRAPSIDSFLPRTF